MKRIAIPIHWDAPDAGYSVLTSPKVASFLFQNLYHKNNLIQTYRSFQTRGKTVLCLQAKRFSAWTVRLPWKKITCTRKTGWLKASPCQTHNNHQKVFVNVPGNEYVAGFAAYLLQFISASSSDFVSSFVCAANHQSPGDDPNDPNRIFTRRNSDRRRDDCRDC